MENYVCSLENSKRLDELGVRRESYFLHANLYAAESRTLERENEVVARFDQFNSGYLKEVLAYAYTVGELGDMLPERTRVTKRYSCYSCLSEEKHKKADTMADAMAKMLIWLLENGHISADEINK